MSRVLTFCAGLFITISLSGCCLHHGYGGYYGGGQGGGCNPGCAPMGYAPGGYPSAGLYGGGMPATALAVPPTTAGYAPYYPQAAMMMPMDPLTTH